MKGMCKDCSRRETCTELCPEAKAYVNQDIEPQHRSSKEIPSGLITGGGKWKYKHSSRLTTDERKLLIYQLHLDGKTERDIAIHVEVARSYVHKVIKETGEKIKALPTTSKNKYLK